MPDVYTTVSTRATPQSEPADDRQVKNSAGGYTYTLDPLHRAERFLILGSDQPTYYASATELTRENARIIFDLTRDDPRGLVDTIVKISEAGRAPKPNPALFALAIVARSAVKPEDRTYALAHLSRVARTGTHLFTFVGYALQFGGWGPALRKAVARWYNDKPIRKATNQVLKYRQRAGWTHRDLLRLAHPKPSDAAHEALFHYVTKGDLYVPDFVTDDTEWFPQVAAYEDAKIAATPAAWNRRIVEGGLTWEMLPTEALTHPEVWATLFESGNLPTGALLRNLSRLTRLGLLTNTADITDAVVARITDPDGLRAARIHPVNALVALHTYKAGQGEGSTWTPVRRITDALDDAFYASFGTIEPTGKRILIAIDCSASMTWTHNRLFGGRGTGPITAREGAAAMAMATARVESRYDIVGFTAGGWTCGPSRGYLCAISELPISPRQRLDDVVRTIGSQTAGATDCALPMLWATARNATYDTVVIYTDNETWAGKVHPHQALAEYRNKVNPHARLIVAGMTSTGFSIADPRDPGSLDVVGFDSATPQIISGFTRGDL